MITSHLLEEAGAGVRLSVPRLTTNAFETAVLQILSSTSHRTHAHRIGSLARRTGGVRAAADSIETVAEHGTAHLQTIGDTHIGSSRLWDVYVALFLLLAGFLWLLRLCLTVFFCAE